MVQEHLMGMLSGIVEVGVEYVDRGDPAAYDWTQATLTTDATWWDLDCSSIVPANAVAIHFYLYVMDDVVGNSISLRKNGNSNAYNVLTLTTQVSNVVAISDGFVSCDANRVIEFLGSNTTFTTIYLLIRGWLI